MQTIIRGLRYDTEQATLLASDRYWDGHNYERHGRNTFLYRTPSGRYFTLGTSQWEGEQDAITPRTPEEARDLWEDLSERAVDYTEAFPGATVEDA